MWRANLIHFYFWADARRMPATQQLSEATQNIGPVYQPLRHDARKSFAPTTEIITENVCYDENPQRTLSQSQWVGVGVRWVICKTTSAGTSSQRRASSLKRHSKQLTRHETPSAWLSCVARLISSQQHKTCRCDVTAPGSHLSSFCGLNHIQHQIEQNRQDNKVETGEWWIINIHTQSQCAWLPGRQITLATVQHSRATTYFLATSKLKSI